MPKPSKNAASVVVRGAKSALSEASKTHPEGSKMPPNGSENGSQAGLRVEYRPLEALTHSDEQVSQIAAAWVFADHLQDYDRNAATVMQFLRCGLPVKLLAAMSAEGLCMLFPSLNAH